MQMTGNVLRGWHSTRGGVVKSNQIPAMKNLVSVYTRYGDIGMFISNNSFETLCVKVMKLGQKMRGKQQQNLFKMYFTTWYYSKHQMNENTSSK